MSHKMALSPGLPGLLQTLQKHPYVDGASKRPRMEECLPLDALEAIMRFLDRETLCTARLVSKTFCTAASAHVCSLSLASTSRAVSLHRYPHLEHVSVTHLIPESVAQLDPGVRDVATALTVRINRSSASIGQTRDYLSQAAMMPKLQKLFVEGEVVHEAAVLARCTNLEAIRFRQCSISIARTIATMTQLTSLSIGRVRQDEDHVLSPDASWLAHATALRNLQSLSICTVDGSLQLIGNLTSLRELAVYTDEGPRLAYSVAPLTRLTRLRSLNIGWEMTETSIYMACCLGLGSLVELDLLASEEAAANCGRFLSRQTALTRLTLRGPQLWNLRHMWGVRMELLQCLKLCEFGLLDAVDLSVLWRATSLTKLSICGSCQQSQIGLSQVLARLTQLRSLRLGWYCCGDDDPNILDLPRALSPLTALTKLKLYWHRLDDGDLGALLVMTGLRVLELVRCRVTEDVLPELGALTSLSSLTIVDHGITSLAPVSEALDPLLNARGLPPLRTSMWCSVWHTPAKFGSSQML